ncbi:MULTISPECIES: sugar transferase [unclassified Devosia]|uniref:sugar transferase n=1 Tax=unclassified Devosia TaxID=196773 RepID=UPI00145CD6B2|nr:MULTISPECIES: sugar transferase [unclassified Devosia]MBJ6989249.1 sugar transferase [Devosia sp. MC521]QMW63336.1 sugar transferase [Devosia sp. MC521]
MGDEIGSIELADEFRGESSSGSFSVDASHIKKDLKSRLNQSGLPLDFQDGYPIVSTVGPQNFLVLAIKRSADIAISLVALIALSPLLVAIACLIKATSAGPLLFTQNREGLNGRVFRMYKFRSLEWAASDHSGLQAVKNGDPRLTKFGAFLRRTSFDELPQLFNIIRGDMSLIGPRPQVPGMLVNERRYDEIVPYYHLRHKMKPGLTGWAQANGLRGPVETPQSAAARVDHDLAYISNFSLTLDVKILVWTLWQELIKLGRGT